MNHLFSLNSPMQNVLASPKHSMIKNAFLILTGVIVLALASQLSIPLTPIPLTFQSATVVLIGMTYGSRRGAYVVAAYLMAGACGLPVFANLSGGIADLFGASGGYLVGFLPAAFLSGYLAEKGWAKHVISSFAAALLGVSVIFFFGISYLSTFIGLDNAITFGFMPFIVSEPIKLIILSCLIPRLWKSGR